MAGDERPILTIDGVTARESRLINHFFHDFKGELSTVLMCLQSLRDGLVDGRPSAVHDRWLGRAIGNARHMVQLINDFRDLTQMEEHVYPSRAERVDLSPRLAALVDEARAMAAERGQRVEASIPPLPTVGFGAALFDRLVGNALQVALYNGSPDETIHVDVRVAETSGPGFVEITVRFAGVTFPTERLETVFDKLAQAREGLQLGRGFTLLFCREAARTLGGDVSLRSWQQHGNEVSIRLPLAPVA